MSNNSNPFDLDHEQVRNKGTDNDVVRATVLDVLPDIHSVRVNPRGDNAPVVAPVLTPKYGMHVLPGEGERVTLLYITENVPVVVGGVYLADGQDPPEAEEGDVIFGNGTGSEITIHQDGHITIETSQRERIDIDNQSAAAYLDTDQAIAGDENYHIVEFDTEEDDTEELFDPTTHSYTLMHGGRYEVNTTIEIPLPGQNNRYTLGIFVNDTLAKRKSRQSVVNEPLSLDCEMNQRLDPEDEIDVRLLHDRGSDSTVAGTQVSNGFNIERKGI